MSAVRIGQSLPEPILVLGAYGYRNAGDEAILAGMLDAIGPQRRLSVISRSPAETEALHGVRAVPLRRALPELARHRSLVIGGGGLFGADLGRFGRLVPYYGLLAALSGRPVAIHGVGLDGELPFIARRLVPRLAARCVELSVRDALSAQRLGVDPARVAIEPDLSARVQASSQGTAHALLRAAGLNPSRPIVALCLTAVNEGLVDPVLHVVTVAMRRLPDVQFCFIPMSQHPFVPAHNDLILGRRLRKIEPRLAIVDGLLGPRDVLSLFGSFTAAVCMRYHSLLFAARAQVPILAMPYAAKCDTWLADNALQPVRLGDGELAARLETILAEQAAA
jgi:polysaccharide pyruvyl transferase WcaK-like protein